MVNDGTDLLEEWGWWGVVDSAVAGIIPILYTVHSAPVATVVEQLIVTRVLWQDIIVSWFHRLMNERIGGEVTICMGMEAGGGRQGVLYREKWTGKM